MADTLTRQPHKTRPTVIPSPAPGEPWTWETRLGWYLAIYHKASLEDIEPTDSPGYWRYKRPCTGCVHPLYGPSPNGCGITHTVRYTDDAERDARGRWLSPYRTWREAVAAREAAQTNEEEDRG